jgi:flavin-dependent dehydrogenase
MSIGQAAGVCEDFDVVVVGGGPAGASTAIQCSRGGLRTLIVAAGGRSDEVPGESLHPGMETLFRALGVDAEVEQAGFLRHPGRVVASGAQRVYEGFGSDHRGEWRGYQADRVRLHAILLEEAVASGASLVRTAGAVRALVLDGALAGVVSGEETYRARMVVDATGSAQWLARQLAIPRVRVSPPLFAEYGWVRPGEARRGLTVPEFRMAGAVWEWVAPVGVDRHAWVRLDLMKRRPGRPLRPPRCLEDCVPVGVASARNVSWTIARPCAGPRYFMVGDAAWTLDPASSHGVFKAVVSGMVAGEAIVNSLHGAADAERQQRGYTAWVENWFCADAEALIASYSATDAPASWLSPASEAVRKIAISPSARAFSSRHTTV